MILLVIVAWAGLAFAEKRAERHGISKDDLNNIVFYSLIAFILGGRTSFILQNISAFSKSPLNIFSINPDIFDIFGALVVSAITLLIFVQRKNLSLWSMLDALTPFFAILSIGLGLSNLAAGTSFGLPTNLPWSIELWNADRHPTQIYNTLASTLIFSLLWFQKHTPRSGILFLSYISLTASSILITAAFRADQSLIFNDIKQDQVIGLIILGISFILFEIRFKQLRVK